MKKTFCRIGLAICLGIAGTASAQALKIGVVSPMRVSAEAPQAQALRDRLEKEFSMRQAELVRMQKEIKGLDDKLARDGAVLKDSERQRIERDALAKRRELRRVQDEAQDDLNLRRNDELGKLQRRIVEVVQQIGKEEKYDLILSDGIVFASEQIDITAKVIERLKQEYRPTPGR